MNLLDFLFPKRCVGCGKVGKYFCLRCSSIIRIIELNEAICPVCEKLAIDGATHPGCRTKYTIDGLISFFRYDGVVRKAVKAIKYRFVSDLAYEFVQLTPISSSTPLSKLLSPKPLGSYLVPIPLHPTRQRFRGFNQAEVLGKLIAQRLEVPMKSDVLERVKKTIPQVEMKDREDRLKNMEGVFAVSKSLAIKQFNKQAIILFDDVFTTGATMRAAANVLKRKGASFVWGITMAR